MSQRTVLEEKVQEQESKITDQDDALSRERKDKREAREAISKAVEKSNERIQEVKTLHTRIQKLETQLETISVLHTGLAQCRKSRTSRPCQTAQPSGSLQEWWFSTGFPTGIPTSLQLVSN